MKRSHVVVQPTLPGLVEPGRSRPAPRRRGSASVWRDPAVAESRALADARHEEWRRSFAGFLAALPARRRAELRRRLGLPPAAHGRVA